MPGAFLCIYVQHNLEAVEYLKATARLVSHTSVQPLSMKRAIGNARMAPKVQRVGV